MPRLHLVRHAHAAAADPGGGDHGRPLDARGRREAAELAGRLAAGALDPRPTRLLVSSARRAVETATALEPALAPARVETEPALYRADADDLVDRLRLLDADDPAVVVVAHNPALADLVALLTGRPPDRFPPAAWAELDLTGGGWSALAAGGARLERLVLPGRGAHTSGQG